MIRIVASSSVHCGSKDVDLHIHATSVRTDKVVRLIVITL